MQIITTHKGADFDAAASVFAAKILYPEAVAVLPKTLNPNVKAFLSIHAILLSSAAAGQTDSMWGSSCAPWAEAAIRPPVPL